MQKLTKLVVFTTAVGINFIIAGIFIGMLLSGNGNGVCVLALFVALLSGVFYSFVTVKTQERILKAITDDTGLSNGTIEKIQTILQD